MDISRRISRALAGLAAPSLIALTFSCTGGSTPTGAAVGFLHAAQQGDRQALIASVQEKDRALLEKAEKAGKGIGAGIFAPPKGDEIELGEEVITGDTATVEVFTARDGKKQKDTLRLVRENGRWWIDLVPDEMLDMMGGFEKMLKTKE